MITKIYLTNVRRLVWHRITDIILLHLIDRLKVFCSRLAIGMDNNECATGGGEIYPQIWEKQMNIKRQFEFLSSSLLFATNFAYISNCNLRWIEMISYLASKDLGRNDDGIS